MKNFFSLLLFTTLLSYNASAAHILSGNIGYECLGNDLYEITIEMERDCYSAGAPFDLEINVAVYIGSDFIQNIEVPVGEIIAVLAEDYEDCMPTTFDYCREKTSYVFQVTLPKIDETYIIAHQRCCWSNIISNIEAPEENGITITTDITPLAQTICNTQEISDAPISFLGCPNVEVSIPFPSFDSEGDSLVYDICLPYAGGGLNGANNGGFPNGCNGVIPIPACPPPYQELTYAPGFDDSNPFPTVDGFSFVDGVLKFTPSVIGFYVSGFCISEYRDGELLSKKQVPLAVVSNVEPSNVEDESHLQSWKIESLTDSRLVLSSAANSDKTSFMLYDIVGRNLEIKQTISGTSLSANIQHLNSGIYFLNIQEGSEVQTIRFFKP